MTATDQPRTWFTAIEDSTAEDWALLEEEDVAFRAGLTARVTTHLRLLEDQESVFPVSRLSHSLQSATRAHRDGRDDAYVACALLHDIGDTIACYNHADIAAAVIKPFVGEDYHWMIERHAIFQGRYFWHHLGADRDAREQFRGQPYFDLTEEFCALYDNPAFDPSYPAMSLEDFGPLLAHFFSTPRSTR